MRSGRLTGLSVTMVVPGPAAAEGMMRVSSLSAPRLVGRGTRPESAKAGLSPDGHCPPGEDAVVAGALFRFLTAQKLVP